LADTHVAGHSAVAHQFASMEQQREAGTLGMWAFLITEIMFFGGLFLAYIIYRARDPEAFAAASGELNWKLGGINTVVLICSSLTMVLAVYYVQTGASRRTQIAFLAATIALGGTFLVVKGFEYHEKFVVGHIPIPGFFKWTGHGDPQHVQIFYWMYFAMTGVHALHMIIGIGVMSVLIYMCYRGRFSPEYYAPVEISGLYWHFVDIVWIFLFPLLYLVGAHEGH